jgi:hypothetical protein
MRFGDHDGFSIGESVGLGAGAHRDIAAVEAERIRADRGHGAGRDSGARGTADDTSTPRAFFPCRRFRPGLLQFLAKLSHGRIMRDRRAGIINRRLNATLQHLLAQISVGLQLLGLAQEDEGRFGRIEEHALFDPVEQP